MVTLAMTLENGSGTDFQASQCFSMDLDTATAAAADAATAADARCVHSLTSLVTEQSLEHCSLSLFEFFRG